MEQRYFTIMKLNEDGETNSPVCTFDPDDEDSALDILAGLQRSKPDEYYFLNVSFRPVKKEG